MPISITNSVTMSNSRSSTCGCRGAGGDRSSQDRSQLRQELVRHRRRGGRAVRPASLRHRHQRRQCSSSSPPSSLFSHIKHVHRASWPTTTLIRSFLLRKVLFLAPSVCGFFVCVRNISRIAERICAKFARKTCLVPRSGEFECQGRRRQKRHSSALGLRAVCLVKHLKPLVNSSDGRIKIAETLRLNSAPRIRL